jgi:DNA-binding MarR family transcriptional regulator/N-acetylglutamate synthase-like GNAT family acetyltransferase
VATINDASVTDRIRRFNRFYTKQIGLLNERVFPSSFSFTEARVMWELANREDPVASDLKQQLGIDAGQLSRIISNFQKRGLLAKSRSKLDGRQTLLNLTAKGKKEFQFLNAASDKQIKGLLEELSSPGQNTLLEAMQLIESLLGEKANPNASYILRPPHAGDYGWVVQKNGELYTNEYCWNENYEGLAAEIVSDFIKNYDPKKERCWIAEKDGENVGCVFLVKKSDTIAKLRLLIVDPKARGLGLGQRLVNECTRFARLAGYKKITLWTQSILTAARHIYEKEGYKLVDKEPHHSFGHDLVAETWELDLTSSPQP